MSYQSIGDRKGSSLSADKLAKIRLPPNLAGKSVLDLGCNEGFFCLEAKRRGAETVQGIDHDQKALASARALAEAEGLDIKFTAGRMEDLPDEKFDYILLLSALHYIPHPAALLDKIRRCLKPNGTLILEIGVHVKSNGKTIGRALRSIDERFFPTQSLLTQVWLRDYITRRMGPSVAQAGDPMPRFVFHCSPAKTNVMFITGKGGVGKTSMAAQLTSAPIISTDELFAPVRAAKVRSTPEQLRYDEVVAETHSIWKTWEKVADEPGMKEYFAKVVASAITHCTGAGTVVVEGFVVEAIAPEVEKILGKSAYNYWKAGRT